MKKRSIGGFSSILVSLPCIGIFFAFTVIASLLNQALIASFCLFVFLIGGFSRFWGFFSARKVSADIYAESKHMFTSDEIEVSFDVQNKKFLPLIWLELLLPMPRRECFMPIEDFEIIEVTMQEAEAWAYGKALKKRFAFLMGKEKLTFSGKWVARSRGVYQVDSLVLRTGDGFGLTQSQAVISLTKMPTFVVYPEIRTVDITPFLALQWDGTGGEKGFLDDLTVMRGMRKYETGDSWKHINWRMVAREQGLNTNLYETVTPKAIHFILDGESFCTAKKYDDSFEETLSTLASIILRLTEAQILCGISMPRSKHMPHTDISATTEISELLTALANYDLLEEREDPGKTDQRDPVFLPSDFDTQSLLRATQNTGRTYYIAKDAKELRLRGFPQRLDTTKLALLTYHEISEDDAYALDVKCMNLRRR